MKINKSSWHYDFINRYSYFPADDLCTYCRQVVSIFVIVTFIILLIAVVLVVIITPWISMGIYLFSNHPMIFIMNDFGVVSLILQAIYVGCALLMYAYKKIKDWRYDQPDPPYKPPGLIKSYYRAWKDKVCPILQFVNDRDEHENTDR